MSYEEKNDTDIKLVAQKYVELKADQYSKEIGELNLSKGKIKEKVLRKNIKKIYKKAHLIPYEYLKYVMERMSSAEVINEELIDELLPWSENIPDYVKNPSET